MNGFFNILKPANISSAKAVYLLKKKLNIKDKIGHMGTLDPLASGVLVVGVGRANRLFDVMLKKRKTYLAEFTFGYETATSDLESDEIVKKSEKIPSKNEIIKVLPSFLGKQQQTAPIFSAKSIGGVRAYKLARQGKVADIKAHEIEIFKFDLKEQKSNDTFVFEIECSGGTYIRSLCQDLAKCVDSVATMTNLKRTKCGDFEIFNSIEIERVKESDIVSVDFALQHMEQINLEPKMLKDIRDGKKIVLKNNTGIFAVFSENKAKGIAEIGEDSIIKMKTWLV